jgi:anti-sigma regulatory factor (Ser/Thr protein kinase)
MRTRASQSGEPSVDVRFCLVFPRESLSVPVMRRVLGDTLRRLGVDEECICDLLLAVTEACTNVLRHAGPGLRYEVVARVGRNRCLLEVLDSGNGFDPQSRPGRRSLSSARPSARLLAVTPARLRRRPAAPPPSASHGPAPHGPASYGPVPHPAASAPHAAAPRALVRHAPVPLLGRLSRSWRLAQERDVAELPESGRGLAIMRACVDDVTLRSGPGMGTVVSMRKRIDLRPGGPLAELPESRLRDAG